MLCRPGFPSPWVTLSSDDPDVSYGALSWKRHIFTTFSTQLGAFLDLLKGIKNGVQALRASRWLSILAWRILWTEEPGGLQSTGSQSQTQLSRHGSCLERIPLCLSELVWELAIFLFHLTWLDTPTPSILLKNDSCICIPFCSHLPLCSCYPLFPFLL